MSYRVLAVLLAACAQSSAANAQLSPSAKLNMMSANQLGIVEYCHDQGHIGADAVAAEREAALSVPTGRLSTVQAEAFGRSGISVSPDGDQLTVAKLAAQQNMTVEAMCRDLGRSSLQFQAAMHGNTGAP